MSGFGSAMGGKPNIGPSKLNSGRETPQNARKSSNSVIVEGTHADNENLMYELNIEKLQTEIESGKNAVKSLELQLESDGKTLNDTMYRILEAEKEKFKLLDDEDAEYEVLDYIVENTRELEVFENPYGIGSDKYQIKGAPGVEIGLVRKGSDLEEFELKRLYKKSRETEGEIIQKKMRLDNLKDSIRKKEETLEEMKDLSPFGDKLDTSGF